MAELSDFKSSPRIKMLLLGNSGTGKTGSLASLAREGYKIRILDYDNGIDSLALQLRNDEAVKNVAYKTCTDKKKSIRMGSEIRIIPDGAPVAFEKGLKALDEWDNLGKVTSWGRDTILVIDSLDFMGMAALDHILALNTRSGQQPWQSDWGDAMRKLEQVLQLLCSDSIQCHVIVLSHIVFIGGDEKTGVGAIGYPAALGAKLPPKVGTYFNSTLLAKVRGSGAATKRVIRTVPDMGVEAKCPILGAPQEFPIETGLADFFKLYIN